MENVERRAFLRPRRLKNTFSLATSGLRLQGLEGSRGIQKCPCVLNAVESMSNDVFHCTEHVCHRLDVSRDGVP